MPRHNVCFWEAPGVSSHESVPRLHKNNQDSPNFQAEGEYHHETKEC